jgi:hypothetical protein
MEKNEIKKIDTDYQSKKEEEIRKGITELFDKCPIPKEQLLSELGLFIKRQDLSRILFLNEIYKKIINVQGVIMEFGVLWGQNLALYESMRGIYEPFNYTRKIIGFDTFEGFPEVDEKDGKADIIKVGSFKVTKNYESYLKQILDYHENESPISHLKKYALVKGDAVIEIEKYLKDNPETIIALAYFDFDIYRPTKKCLESIKAHLTKGSILIFDQLNFHDYPGETQALKEILGINNVKIMRSPYTSIQSYIIID